MLNSLITPSGIEIFFTGPRIEAGTLPAIFYFALSGEESLMLHPYNQPTLFFHNLPCRVFSFDIPAHGKGLEATKAMEVWAHQFAKGEDFLKDFFSQLEVAVKWLIEEKIAHPEHLASVGLSRGGFFASHLSSREKRIKTLLAFSPLTRLSGIKEFQEKDISESQVNKYDLMHLIPELLHLHQLRFYIGNRDTRVQTDFCYQFIRSFAEVVHEKRERHLSLELFLTQSIGHQGHGTSPETFEEGSQWLKSKLLKNV